MPSWNSRDPLNIPKDLQASHSILDNKGKYVAIFMLCDSIIIIVRSRKVTQGQKEIPTPIMIELLQEVGRETQTLVYNALQQ